MSDSLFIDDGYTARRTIPATPGLHPELVVAYRPALSNARHAYRQKLASPDPAVIESHEVDLVARYVVSVNGVELKDKDKIGKLKPAVRAHLVDLILGYTPADEVDDARNLR